MGRVGGGGGGGGACLRGRSSSVARRRTPRRRTRSRSAPRAVCRAARRRVRKRRQTRDTLEERGFTPRDALQDQRVGALRQQLRLRIRVLRPAQQLTVFNRPSLKQECRLLHPLSLDVCTRLFNTPFLSRCLYEVIQYTLSLSMSVRGYSIHPLSPDVYTSLFNTPSLSLDSPLSAHPESPRDASRGGATGARARASSSLSTGARSFAMAPTTQPITSVSPATACAATFATEARSRPLRSRGHVRSVRGARARRVRCRRAARAARGRADATSSLVESARSACADRRRAGGGARSSAAASASDRPM